MAEEYWDLYDENRMPLNRTIKRGDKFADGEYYVCCEIWIQNSLEQFLITQRHPNKKAGGLWEFTGGGVLAGESTKQAAVREVKEEIGFDIREDELVLLTVFKNRNYFMDVYVLKRDINLKDLNLQADEVVDAKWSTKDELHNLMQEKQFVSSVAFRYNQYAHMLEE